MIDLNNIQAVIFDMDGTLIDSMWVWKQIDIDYMDRFGLEYSKSFHHEIEGMNFYDTACYFKSKFFIEDSIEKIMDDWHKMAYDKYVNEIEFKAGVIEFINTLKINGIKTGIATSNSRELVDAFLNSHNANNLFDYIATASEVKSSKPAPDIYLTVASNLKVEPKNCLVFEDIPNGILAGKNAGMSTCAVYDEHSADCDDEKRNLADYYINSYMEINR